MNTDKKANLSNITRESNEFKNDAVKKQLNNVPEFLFGEDANMKPRNIKKTLWD